MGDLYDFDIQKLRLNISVPQAYLNKKPRGYTSPNEWSSGETALFINYNGSYYHSENNVDSKKSSYVGLKAGINLGLWHIRNHSSFRSNDTGSAFTSLRTYVNRPLPRIYSDLSLGQLYTTSTGFGSLAFTGVQLKTDNRMLPNSQRGYAPIVRGIAQTTARIVIKQNGKDIYTTTVAAGPFVIDDLFPTSYQGDLDVEIQEANGQVSSFIVPFNAVPGSMRAGRSQYALSLGKNRNTGDDDYFVDFTYEQGLSNALTLNTAVRVANGYQAFSAGSVINTLLGAVGGTLIYSHAKIDSGVYAGDTDYSGWRAGLNYSRSFLSGTSVTLAGYKYSMEGYRELSDVFQQRYYFDNYDGYGFTSGSYHQKTEMSLNMTQQLDYLGSFSISASKRQYRDDRKDEDSYSASYNKQFNNYNMRLNYSRVYTGSNQYDGRKNDVVSLSLTVPLGNGNKTLISDYVHSGSGSNNYNLGLSGFLDNDPSFSYSIGASRQINTNYDSNNFYASVNKRTSVMNLSANYSQGDDYRQISSSANGSLVIHQGGVTLGQSVGDTFAIIEASDAEGAKIKNSFGTELNSNGYGILSNLSPYRINRVILDSGNMDENIELVESQQEVIPYSGSVVRLKYQTRKGLPIIFNVKLDTGEVVPLGSDILDQEGEVLGTVGQAGLAYVRLEDKIGELILVWGEGRQERCSLDYDLTLQPTNVRLLNLPAVCIISND